MLVAATAIQEVGVKKRERERESPIPVANEHNLWDLQTTGRVKTFLVFASDTKHPRNSHLHHDICCPPGNDLMSYLVQSISLNSVVQRLIIHFPPPHLFCLLVCRH